MEGFQKITTEAMTFYFCYFKNVMIIDNEWVINLKEKCFNGKKINVCLFLHASTILLYTSFNVISLHYFGVTKHPLITV